VLRRASIDRLRSAYSCNTKTKPVPKWRLVILFEAAVFLFLRRSCAQERVPFAIGSSKSAGVAFTAATRKKTQQYIPHEDAAVAS
jgi:hypothetical protein